MKQEVPLGVKVIGVGNVVIIATYCLFGLFFYPIFKILKYHISLVSVIVLVISIGVNSLICWILTRLLISTYRLKNTARINNICLSVFLGLPFLVYPQSADLIKNSAILEGMFRISMIIYFVWQIFYLNRPKVKEQFR